MNLFGLTRITHFNFDFSKEGNDKCIYYWGEVGTSEPPLTLNLKITQLDNNWNVEQIY